MASILRICCFWKTTTPSTSQYSRNIAFVEPKLGLTSFASTKCKTMEYRSSFLHRLFHRRTTQEHLLLLEKRYLKAYLRHYQLYLDHMTLPEMRTAKRCLEDSLNSYPSPSPRCTSMPISKANSKSKHVSFHRTLVRYIPVEQDDGSSDDSDDEGEISTLQLIQDGEFDFGPFLLGGNNEPSYVAFEQPEP